MILKKKNLKFKSLLIGGIIFLLSTLALGYFILSRKRIYVKFSEKSSSKPTKTEILEDINQKFVALETILKDPKIGIWKAWETLEKSWNEITLPEGYDNWDEVFKDAPEAERISAWSGERAMEIFKLFGDKLINQEIKLEDLSKEELKIVLFFIDEAKSYINFLEKEFKDKGRSIPTQKIETQKKLELIIALIASKTSEDSENKVLETSQEIKFRVTINKFIDNLDKGKREVLLWLNSDLDIPNFLKKDIKVIRILFYDDQQSFTALRKFQDLRNLISEKTYVDLTLKNVKLHLVEYSNEKGVGILNIPYRAYGEIELLTRSEE